VWGFGRAIALWGFNVAQQFRADSDIDLCRKFLIAELALMECSMQIALPNRTTFPLSREAGLVQIAESLSEEAFLGRYGGRLQAVANQVGLVDVVCRITGGDRRSPIKFPTEAGCLCPTGSVPPDSSRRSTGTYP